MNAAVIALDPVRKARMSRAAKARDLPCDAERMEAIGRFASGIVHDFNSVLASIGVYADMLARQAQDIQQKQCAERMVAATTRGRNLVGQLLSFVRTESSGLAPTELCANVAESVEMVRGLAGRGVSLEASIPGAPVFVMADATQIGQVVTNLCTNAIQAMPAGGRLGVAVTTVEIPLHRVLSHGKLAPGRHALLCVEDDGCGMDHATLARAFEPFFTTKGAGRGTGLGLAIVKTLVERFGGAIDVRTSPAAGTRFDVYLPVSRP